MLMRSTQEIPTPPEESPFLAIVRDPLTSVSRSNRRTLVALSGIAIGIRAADLLPSQISALGITLSVADQKWFVRFLWICVLYLLVTFVIYAVVDYWAWQEHLHYRLRRFVDSAGHFNVEEAVESAMDTLSGTPTIFRANSIRLKGLLLHYSNGELKGVALIWKSSPMAAIRLCLDLVLPVVVALTALVLLWSWPIKPPAHGQGTPVIERSEQQRTVAPDPGVKRAGRAASAAANPTTSGPHPSAR